MPIVFRAHDMRFVIYVDDHAPAHVHVIGDGSAKIAFEAETAYVDANAGMSKRDLQRALTVVEENRVSLLAAWKDIHG